MRWAWVMLTAVSILPRISDGGSQAEIVASAGVDKPIGAAAPTMSRQLVLKGSRGEILNFMLKLSGEKCRSFSVTPFRRSGGPQIKLPVRFWKMGTIATKNPSFPGAFVGKHFDPLLPISDGMFCVPKGESGISWILGELEVPRDLDPGDYQGALNVRGLRGLPISVRVWKMRISDRPALPGYSAAAPWPDVVGHFGKWAPQEGRLARMYYQEMVRHRIYPYNAWVARPRLIENGKDRVLDLNGVPNGDDAFIPLTVKTRPDWAYFDFPKPEPTLSEEAVGQYWIAIEKALRQHGWEKRGFVYLWDEPKPADDAAIIRMAKKVREGAPDLKILVTTTFRKNLNPYVDIFCPPMNYWGEQGLPGSEAYSRLREAGREVWWYVSCMSHGCDRPADPGFPDLVLDRPAVYIRSIGWLSRKYGVSAFLYYSLNYAYSFYPKRDPWADLWYFSGNGDGTLFYPGRPGVNGLTEHMPIASLRLKAWRESSFDADYVKQMEELSSKPDWWTREYQGLVPNLKNWSRDYRRYQELRDRIGEYLNSLQAQ